MAERQKQETVRVSLDFMTSDLKFAHRVKLVTKFGNSNPARVKEIIAREGLKAALQNKEIAENLQTLKAMVAKVWNHA